MVGGGVGRLQCVWSKLRPHECAQVLVRSNRQSHNNSNVKVVAGP